MTQNNFDGKKIVAITGGIASGKNAVGDILTEKGYTVIDSDKITKRLNLKGGKCYNAIIKEFGKEFLNDAGEIDKKKFSSYVFSDKKLAQKLNAVTHPIIIKKINEEILKSKSGLIFVLIPLLFESNMQKLFYKVWTVSAGENLRITRAMQRDGLNKAEIENIIKSQISEIERNKYADTIIYNDRTVKELRNEVEKALNSL